MNVIGSRGGGAAAAWLLPAKVAAASAGVVAVAVTLKLVAPPAAGFLAEELPRVYGSLLCWLQPPYLYFVINGIIISIAATSRFQKFIATTADDGVIPSPATEVRAEVVVAEVTAPPPELLTVYPTEIAGEGDGGGTTGVGEEEGEEFVISRSNWKPKKPGETARDTKELSSPATDAAIVPVPAAEKPLVSERFGHRRSMKASPEGKALGVARSRRHETLESTWRTITEGRAVPLARHLKKSDTWENAQHACTEIGGAAATAAPPPPQPISKSETFADRSIKASAKSPSSGGSSGSGLRRQPSSGKLRREPSLGQDDLNRRVEAFIKKFNEEMRLQRQESMQQYLDMVKCSAH